MESVVSPSLRMRYGVDPRFAEEHSDCGSNDHCDSYDFDTSRVCERVCCHEGRCWDSESGYWPC